MLTPEQIDQAWSEWADRQAVPVEFVQSELRAAAKAADACLDAGTPIVFPKPFSAATVEAQQRMAAIVTAHRDALTAPAPDPVASPLAAQRAIFVATLADADAGKVVLSAPDRAGMEVAIAFIDDKIGATP